MANYVGAQCLICGERFKEGDDIVVCPECGTPYHRDCYIKEGSCVNTKLHEQHGSWRREPEQNAFYGSSAQGNVKICRNCGTVNRPHSLLCEKCGTSLVDGLDFGNTANSGQGFAGGGQAGAPRGFAFDLSDKYAGMDPNEKLDEDMTVGEAADFIQNSSPYYLILFKKMKETGEKVTLNVACIFFPQFYFAYRKMPALSFLIILLSSVLAVPLMLTMPFTMPFQMNEGISLRFLNESIVLSPIFMLLSDLASYASLAVNVLTCLFGNYLYMRNVKRKVSQIKSASGGDRTAAEEGLRRAGGTSPLMLLLAVAVQFLLAVLTAFAFWKI